MADPIHVAIQGVSYAKITQINPNEVYDLIPFDLNGNLFKEVTIECDTTNYALIINLPEISTLNGNYNISIRVIALNAGSTGNIVSIYSPLATIGSSSPITLEADATNVILIPVSSENWYGVVAL